MNFGKTETKGLYVQEVWRPLPDWKFTAGARGEWWRAFGGMNATGGFGNASNPTGQAIVGLPLTSREHHLFPGFL